VRICLLTSQELDVEVFPENDWPCDPRPFLPEADWNVATLSDKKNAPEEVAQLLGQGFDLFFNLCDGAADQEDTPGIEVVEMLEKHGVPFTGATSNFYEPSRLQMKDACKKVGVSTPACAIASNEEDVERAADTLRFPLFVKHYSSYASVDISRKSRVRTPAGLRRQARKIMSRHGAALIEEYIEGTECTVLVAENPEDPTNPITYTPIQYCFPEGESFKHSKLKWEDFDGLSFSQIADSALDCRLREESARFFVALGGTSFGRCDIRVDPSGTPFMLEVNPNCGVFYPRSSPGSADIILNMDPAGHVGFVRQLVAAAIRRNSIDQAAREADSCNPE